VPRTSLSTTSKAACVVRVLLLRAGKMLCPPGLPCGKSAEKTADGEHHDTGAGRPRPPSRRRKRAEQPGRRLAHQGHTKPPPAPRRRPAGRRPAPPPRQRRPLVPRQTEKKTLLLSQQTPPLCSKADRDREGESDPSKGHTDAPHPARSLKLASFPRALLNERKQLP
jgi:hypothetical protein